ncbi:MAG: ATP-dependent DNA helicase RecQ, partial [Chlamydiales bacterium]
RVREDIVAQLGLVDPVMVVGDCDRPNLTYRIAQRGDLLGQVVNLAGRHPGGAGIVYCIRRKDVEKLARDLAGRGLRCLPYHAGLPAHERRRVQDAFQGESIDIVVATVAFGMGIDRPDVRFVAHASLPKGVEQYSQETGRAGRDGLPSECVLFFSGSDFHSWKGLMERGAKESELTGYDATDELQNSIDRLGHMWNLAGGAACRHRSLVEYFGGEWSLENCGACDVCLGELETVEDSQVVAQKILSCVVRCEQRYGGGHVADVLRGAKTARIRQLGHDNLSTYGLLSQHATRDLRAWIDQLVAAHHLGVAPGDYPTLYLTQSGLAVMKGEQDISLFLPRKPAKKKRQLPIAEEGGPPPDEGLFEHLRKLRRKLAAERAVPPYILFNDRTLVAMSAHKPTDDAGFRALKGVGDKKAVDLGPPFLAAIADYLDE